MLNNLLFKHIDNSSLIVFRVIFGLLCFLESVGAIFTGWIRRTLIEPEFTFSFIGFEWLQPLPGNGMYFYYAIMGVFGLFIMLGYRYRIINQPSFSIYGQVKLATVNFTSVTFIDENAMEVDLNDTSFDAPFIFGIGSDIKVGDQSFITIIYGELFALLLDNQGNFSTDIAIGYKFNL